MYSHHERMYCIPINYYILFIILEYKTSSNEIHFQSSLIMNFFQIILIHSSTHLSS